MKNNKRINHKGITLIALIITIIIMLILAGIVINLTIGENGIIPKAQEAGIQYEQEKAREKLNLALLDLDSKKLSEQGRHLQLEELLEIEDASIDIQVTSEEKVKIFSEEGKNAKYAIATVDGYQFKVYENLELELIGKRKEELEDNVLGYIQEGLIVLYDGENNIGNGHSDVTNIWKNLAPISEENIEGQNDGTLMNIDFTNSSGWTDNSLVLDGVDDWVKMSYLHYENMTVEIVAKPLDTDTTKSQCYISNYQTGGMGISKINSGYTRGQAYIGGEYKLTVSNNNTMIGQIYSMSTGYDGGILYFRENEDIYQTQTTGSYTQPANSTIFAIGTNPSGTTENILSGESRFNIEVYSVRIYNRCLTEEEIVHNYEIDKERFHIEQLPKQEKLGYVEDGLICLYDGEQNTPYGHSKKNPIWVDLSGNGNDGTLMNIDFTNSSGWTDNSLVLDGVDDWVKMTYMHYENMTVEIVAKPLDITTKSQCYICNYQAGGMGISKVNSGYTKGQAYIGEEYKFAISNNNTMIGQIYSMSTGYDGSILYFRENEDMYQTQTTGSYTQPANSTIFAIGTNPSGTTENIPSGESRFNIEVYSVRIYNRCLTEEEIEHNYEIDKQRFEI